MSKRGHIPSKSCRCASDCKPKEKLRFARFASRDAH